MVTVTDAMARHTRAPPPHEENAFCLKMSCLVIGILVWMAAVCVLGLITWEAIVTRFKSMNGPLLAIPVSIALVADTLLLIGIYKKKPGYMKPCMFMNILLITICVLAFVGCLLIALTSHGTTSESGYYVKCAIITLIPAMLCMWILKLCERLFVHFRAKSNIRARRGGNGIHSPPPGYTHTHNPSVVWSTNHFTGPSHMTSSDVCTSKTSDYGSASINDTCMTSDNSCAST